MERTQSERVPYVVQHFPSADNLRKVLRSLQHLLDDDTRLREVFPQRPILAIRQPPNLKQTLVRSKLPEMGTVAAGPTTVPCNSSRGCKTCNMIDRNDTATIKRDQTEMKVQGRFSCNSTNLIYLIRCKKDCPGAWYIGETKQTLRERMTGHRQSIARKDSTLPIPSHFNSAGHSVEDMKVCVLRGGLSQTKPRRTEEQRLIAKFRTHSEGLNRDLDFLSRYN